jgi:hypothetical protein
MNTTAGNRGDRYRTMRVGETLQIAAGGVRLSAVTVLSSAGVQLLSRRIGSPCPIS